MPEPKTTRPPTLLERWKMHATRRAEFAALLQEPAMQDALAIVREQVFKPKPVQPGMPNLMEYTALMSQVREGYLEMLTNFLSLANVSPFKTPDRKPWETVDKDAALQRLREAELGGSPQEQTAANPEN